MCAFILISSINPIRVLAVVTLPGSCFFLRGSLQNELMGLRRIVFNSFGKLSLLCTASCQRIVILEQRAASNNQRKRIAGRNYQTYAQKTVAYAVPTSKKIIKARSYGVPPGDEQHTNKLSALRTEKESAQRRPLAAVPCVSFMPFSVRAIKVTGMIEGGN